MKELSAVSRIVTPSPIREMFNRAMGMEDVVSFTVGEPDFRTPDHIVEAAVQALHRGEHKYTPNAGILPLRQAISIARRHPGSQLSIGYTDYGASRLEGAPWKPTAWPMIRRRRSL